MKLYERQVQTGTSWYIDYRDDAGRRKRHLLRGIKTQENAENALADFRLRYERNQLELPTDRKILLSMVLQSRIDDRRLAGCVPGWIGCLKNYKRHLLNHYGNDCPFRSLNDQKIAEYRLKRQDDGASAETINKELMFLAAAGKLSFQQGKVGKLPWNKIDRAIDRHAKEAWGYLKSDEINRLLVVLKQGTFRRVKKKNNQSYPMTVKPSIPMWRMITFLLNTGARRGEMFALRWSDVVMENRTVRLVSSKSAKNGQSAKMRYIPMNPALVQMFEGMKRGASNDHVFRKDINLRRKFKMALQWAELPEYRIHDLRHTFASHLCMAGIPLFTVSRMLGHSSIETTQRYAHLAPDAFERAVCALSFVRQEQSDGACENADDNKGEADSTNDVETDR